MRIGTCMLEKSFVIASIMCSKNKHLGETFVTTREGNIIQNKLIKEFNKKDMSVCITDKIDTRYFKVNDDVIVMNEDNGIDLQFIKDRYTEYISSLEIAKVLWDDIFIFNCVNEIKENNHLQFEPCGITEIIDKILKNPDVFYEKIAKELSKEEYKYLKEKIEDRNCKNCKNMTCNREAYQKIMYNCDAWENDRMIGKIKILNKN